MDDKNFAKKKILLIIIMLSVIIGILLIGVIYQFICIKNLQSQINDLKGYISLIFN